ncbi:MAG TPA: serine protein kinase RIO [Candidatus Norongarragalinales archaeon]|nr:serine protein kinase RIO [Candidatus Norongarragalinales archaeon]
MGKRKQPTREAKQIKFALKITDRVLDDQTTHTLANLMNAKEFRNIDYAVSQGKEAVVFKATCHDGSIVAVKVFKFETTAFRKMVPYIEGDPRFNVDAVKHSKRALVKVWARKEYANLSACFQKNVSVPRPLVFKENVIVMEFIGVEGKPCALLQEVVVQNPEKVFKQLLGEMRKMHSAGIVHGDLSPYNVMLLQTQNEDGSYAEKAFIIDLAQGVSLKHPKALEFLERDVANIVHFFSRLDVESKLCNEKKALEFVLKG